MFFYGYIGQIKALIANVCVLRLFFKLIIHKFSFLSRTNLLLSLKKNMTPMKGKLSLRPEDGAICLKIHF